MDFSLLIFYLFFPNFNNLFYLLKVMKLFQFPLNASLIISLNCLLFIISNRLHIILCCMLMFLLYLHFYFGKVSIHLHIYQKLIIFKFNSSLSSSWLFLNGQQMIWTLLASHLFRNCFVFLF